MSSGTRRSDTAAAVALLTLVLTACAGPLPEPPPTPRRICSVSLAGDEWLALLVPAERVVCVSALADDRELSNVAGRFPETTPRLAARIEPVLARAPDLVLAAPWNDRAFLDLLARSGVPSLLLDDVHDFDGIRRQLRTLGARLDAERRAAERLADLDRRLAALDDRLRGVTSRPRVLSLSHMVVAGAKTTVDAVIARAGGTNAAAEVGVIGHRKLPAEQILALDPDVLLLGQDPGESIEAMLASQPALRALRAAREGRIVVLPPRLLTTVTPFLVEGAIELAAALHPDRFGEDRPR